MSLLIVGTLAFDDIETPAGRAENEIGGSAAYAAVAASFATPVRVVAIVGEDFPSDTLAALEQRGVDLTGVTRGKGPSFRWAGRYHENLNLRDTLDTQLNVLTQFQPKLPDAYRDTDIVFLANIDPELQLSVLDQLRRPRLVACDTMNFWLANARPALLRVLERVDVLIVNDEEARELAQVHNVVKAASAILRLGPKRVLVKRGEYGVLAFEPGSMFAMPAYPLEEVFDPTGAGDTFAGGFLGHLASAGDANAPAALRRAIAHGSVLASLVVERFGLRRLWELRPADIEERRQAFLRLTDFHTV
ncbi:MAG TPA: PfkB family carbohydrate kinase [Candidatus Binatia bacterium]|nr:PfkB family carbohydrate kinase [Candidatus Binatia bacterium]